jgi:hypothetical protein
MTIELFAKADIQEALYEGLSLNNLEPDIRKCKIKLWLGVFEYCVDKPIGYFRYFDNKIKPEMLDNLVFYAKEKLKKTSENFVIKEENHDGSIIEADINDILKMVKYLSICLQYKATLVIS